MNLKQCIPGSIFLGLCFFSILAHASESYVVDKVHTRVVFEVSHAGLSNAIGSFSKIEGRLELDETDWSKSSFDITIPLKTLHFGDDDWQQKILGKAYFDEAHFPTAHFVSTRIEKINDTTANIQGQLTIRGVTLPVTLDMQLNAIKRHPLSLKKTVGASATTKLSRKAFGMTSWPNLIGDDVSVKIEFEATRTKNDSSSETKDSNNAATKP
jgi:polyisoprenoid-binding protein YceI